MRTLPLIRQAQALGKRVAVPKVYGETDMRFLWLDDPARIAPGAYGIPEPVDDGPEADDPAALVLMPGLAFDPQGHRLGYGGGFYDRFLAAEPHPTIALCYALPAAAAAGDGGARHPRGRGALRARIATRRESHAYRCHL